MVSGWFRLGYFIYLLWKEIVHSSDLWRPWETVESRYFTSQLFLHSFHVSVGLLVASLIVFLNVLSFVSEGRPVLGDFPLLLLIHCLLFHDAWNVCESLVYPSPDQELLTVRCMIISFKHIWFSIFIGYITLKVEKNGLFIIQQQEGIIVYLSWV